MLRNRYVWAGVILALLLVVNIVRWLFADWGLITVRVHDAPLGQVIKSIERQGWVTIYTNIDPSTLVSMDVIKVPLAEAMETLSVNVPPPAPPTPPPDANRPADGTRPEGGRQRGFGRGGGGGGGGRGFGGGVQWKLAFFTAPTSAQVKKQIYDFQAGGSLDDDLKIYSYGTGLQAIATEDTPIPDPRGQVWPGMPSSPPVREAGPDGQTPPPPTPPSTEQEYLNVMAQAADIWIMSPSSWDPKISSAPAAGNSIISAVQSVVSRGHGAVRQAIVLYARPPRQRREEGQPRQNFADTGWFTRDDRTQNAINGLPVETRPTALGQLKDDRSFRQKMRNATPEQRREMFRQRMMNRSDDMGMSRRSPERRAQIYSRLVSNRQAAQGVGQVQK